MKRVKINIRKSDFNKIQDIIRCYYWMKKKESDIYYRYMDNDDETAIERMELAKEMMEILEKNSTTYDTNKRARK